MREFSYRPAALRGARQVGLSDVGLRHAGGPERAWTDLTGAELQAQQVRGVEFVTLRLEFGEAVETLSWSGVGPELAEFFGLLREVLIAASGVHPELQVRFGPSGGYRIAHILLALSFVALGVFLCGVAFVLAMDNDWSVAVVMGPVGLLAGYWGGVTLMAQRPGQAQQTKPIAEVIEMLADARPPRSDAENAVLPPSDNLPEN